MLCLMYVIGMFSVDVLLYEQKNGVPLSRKSLIDHARADVGFFRLICDLPQQFIEVASFAVSVNGNYLCEFLCHHVQLDKKCNHEAGRFM